VCARERGRGGGQGEGGREGGGGGGERGTRRHDKERVYVCVREPLCFRLSLALDGGNVRERDGERELDGERDGWERERGGGNVSLRLIETGPG